MGERTNDPPSGLQGPFLILAAFWQHTDNTDEVADVLRESDFPTPEGFSRGAVVAFRYEVANSFEFRRDLGRLDLDELNARPKDAARG